MPLPRDLPPWVADYVGIPWRPHGCGRDGCDCWGLVGLVMAERFGKRLPFYGRSDPYADGRYATQATFTEAQRESGLWLRTATPSVGEVALFNIAGHPVHVGLVVGDTWMLHIDERTDACVERFTNGRWIKRLEGTYRYVG